MKHPPQEHLQFQTGDRLRISGLRHLRATRKAIGLIDGDQIGYFFGMGVTSRATNPNAPSELNLFLHLAKRLLRSGVQNVRIWFEPHITR
jgi:hypothetical protein